jgi:RNA polymerase sigma factor (sigma-70 family)
MEAMTSYTTGDITPDAVRPLQNAGHYREPAVEIQIRRLLTCSPGAFRQAVRQSDRSVPDYVQEETLVYFLREKHRRGEKHDAAEIAELIVRRINGHLYRQITAQRLRSAQRRDDCIQDMVSTLWLDLFDLSARSQFWEVRFWTCLQRRLSNTLKKYQTTDRNEVTPEPLTDGEGHETPLMDTWAAPQKLSPQDRVEIREALALLTERERKAFYLFYYEDWTQAEIASHLQVTDRTIRNLLGHAEKTLAHWRENRMTTMGG